MESTSESIVNKIASVHKNKTIDAPEIEEWCSDAIINVGEASLFVPFRNAVLTVINGKGVLPCNLYRLQTVKPLQGNGVIYYERHGDVLNFDRHHVTNIYTSDPDPSQTTTTRVKIDFLGIPLNTYGKIMIDDSVSLACYWYCLSKLYEEDFIGGRMELGRWQEIQAQYGHYALKAKQSMVRRTNNDLDQINRVCYNQILDIRTPQSL